MMKKTIIKITAVLTALLWMINISHAQEVVVENDTGFGARAMGMGGAQVAAVNDLTALLYNPAALARLNQLEVQFGLNMMKRKLDTSLKSASGTGLASATTDYSGLGTVGIVYPVPTERGSLVFGAAYNRVKGFAGNFKIDGYNDYLKGYQTGESIEEGGVGVISLGGAVDISQNVSVGAAFDIWLGDYKRDSRSLLNDETDPYSQLDLKRADDDISAWSFKPAILYFKDDFRFGAYARLPMTFHIDESVYSEGYSRDDGEYFSLYEYIDPSSEFTDDEVTYVDNIKYKIKTPMQIGFGVSWGTPGRNSMAFDLIYENWTQAKLEYPSDYMPEPNYFRDKYRSALSWRVGVEKKLPFFNSVGRLGYMRQPLLFKGPRGYEAGEPRISVTNERDFITVGFGKNFDRSLGMDIGYTYGLWSQEETPREEEENRSRVYVSITYRTQINK